MEEPHFLALVYIHGVDALVLLLNAIHLKYMAMCELISEKGAFCAMYNVSLCKEHATK